MNLLTLEKSKILKKNYKSFDKRLLIKPNKLFKQPLNYNIYNFSVLKKYNYTKVKENIIFNKKNLK